MKRLLCWFNGHRWEGSRCLNCGHVNVTLKILDALGPVFASYHGYLEAQAKLLSVQAESTRRDNEKLEVVQPLTEHEELALNLGRQYPHLVHHLPQSIQKILKAETTENPDLYAPEETPFDV